MLALAGVAVLADDASADDNASEFKNDSKGDYTVTYTYGGSSIVKKMSSGNQFQFNVADISGFDAPKGYEFDKAFIDQKSGAVYNCTSPYTFTSDIIVEPKVAPAQAIVKLVYGDISAEYMGGSDATESYTVTSDDLKDFAKKIGATVVKTGDSITRFAIDGYKFDGFKPDVTEEGNADLTMTLTAEKVGITTYTLVMEKVYNVTFVLDGTILKSEKTSGDIVAPENPDKEHYSFNGWFDKDGNKFDPAFEAYTADIIYTAEFTPNTYKVYFMNGETVVAERSSEYMGQIDLPDLPEGFISWADKDGNVVGSPVTITGPDMKFYAVAGIVKYSVAFVNGEQTVATVEVVKGEKIAADDIPALPEGVEKWDFDFETPITENITVKAVAKVYDVTFDFGVMYATKVTIQVEHGQVIPADKVPVIPEEFPEKDKRWNYDPAAPVESDMTIQLRDNIYFEVVFVAGETEVAKVSVLEGTAVPADKVPAIPEGYKEWAFDVAAPVTADMTVEAVAKEVVFNVTFEIEGKADVTQKSDSLTIPDVTREGYEFQGWVVAGTSKYVDPTKYEYTADVTFVAIYKQIGYSTVTFIIGEEVIEISVKNGTTIPADKIPELDPAVYSGWDFDINMVIDQSQSFKAVPILYHKVVFEYGADTGIPSVTVEVADGTTIPADKIPAIPAQLGDVRWDYSNSTVRDDMTIGLVDVVYPEEPGFFDTTSGKIAGAIILLAVLVVIALLVAPASPMNYKIVKGKVAGVIEARRADKKP